MIAVLGKPVSVVGIVAYRKYQWKLFTSVKGVSEDSLT